MKLFVTGGTGFLGSRICAAARAAGHQVLAMSRHPERLPESPPGVTVVQGELTDQTQLSALLAQAAPEVLIHAAAVVTDDDPRLSAVNVGGTAALIAALTSLPVQPRLVLLSTFSVEDIPPTRYSRTKQEAEELVRASGLAQVILRPALIYGPGDGTNTPALVARMRSGSHWIPAGGATRIQPVFVDDVAKAVIAAAERPGVDGHVYRLAGPEPLTVRAFREAVRDATGGQAVVRSIPLAPLGWASRLLSMAGKTGAEQICLFHRADHAVDIEDSRRDLGFRPRSLEAGLAATFPASRP